MGKTATFLIGVCAVTTACASGGGRTAIPARTDYGVYAFREAVTTLRPAVMLEGHVQLTPDTIAVSLASAPCIYDQRSRDLRVIRYTCGNVAMMFDRREPMRENSYQIRAQQTVTVEVCAQVVNNVCRRTQNQSTLVDVMRSGKIRTFRSQQ